MTKKSFLIGFVIIGTDGKDGVVTVEIEALQIGYYAARIVPTDACHQRDPASVDPGDMRKNQLFFIMIQRGCFAGGT